MITLDDLEKARYEIKFNANVSAYHRLLEWINLHPKAFMRPYPTRIVNNIYFDNEELDSFQENMAGVSSRTKLRLRWYGDTFFPIKTTFELKMKRNKLGWKVTDTVFFEKALHIMSYTEIRQHLYANISDDLKIHFMQSDTPALLNRYKRDYFICVDNKIRVTLDRHTQFFDQRFSNSPNTTFSAIAPEMLIMEFKMAAKDSDIGERIVGDVDVQRTKSSKYAIGMQSILGY